MTRVYCRCNSGHYFVGAFCPFDGWSSAESKAIAAAAERLAEAGITPSIAALQETGVGPEALARTLVIEFGSDSSAFEGLAPEEYVVCGRGRSLVEMDVHFK